MDLLSDRVREFVYRRTRTLRTIPGKIYVSVLRVSRNHPLIRYFIETCGILLRRGPVVTVFGSCRQDAVQHNFAVTPIRDGLTYPHFTREVLQAIAYCSRPYGPRPPDLAFRTGQLGKRLLPRWLAFVAFLRTDVFVVEVASALSYESGRWVFHHELYDNFENVQGRQTHKIESELLDSITPVVMDWISIRQDLERIVTILGAKRVVFVTHFSTRSEGKRFELASAIESFLEEVGIPVINPSSLLGRWTAQELFVNEPVVSHYTPLGHSIIGGIYRDEILMAFESCRRNPRRPLVQVVDNSPEKVARHTFHGWGDIVLGAAFLFQEARRQGRLSSVDWSGFSAADWLDRESTNLTRCDPAERAALDDTAYLFHGSPPRKFWVNERVFTNRRPHLPLDGATRDFLKRCGVSPGPEVAKAVERFLVENELGPRSFVALHIRNGDGSREREGYRNLLSQTVRACVNEVRNVHGESLPIIVMTDSVGHSDAGDAEGVRYSNSKPGHLGLPGDEEAARDGLVDFFLMGLAGRIYSASAYSWGSGFSLAASQLFDVELVSLNSSPRSSSTRQG